MMKATIYITLKQGVLDPQGRAIAGALSHMGFDQVEDVRQGKYIEVILQETDRTKAQAMVQEMCEKLLANLVIENFSFELVE